MLLDVDGTLLHGRSAERLFLHYLVEHGQLGWHQWAYAAAFCLRGWPRYGKHVMKKNKAYLAGLAERDIAVRAERFVRDTLTQRLRPSILERLDRHHRAGDPIALLTGTPDFIAAPLALYIGAAAFTATRCTVADGSFAAAPPRVHPFGPDKLVQAQGLCEHQGWRLGDCTAYADSMHDLELLQRVGHPVAVHPDRRLRAAANRHGWEIIER